MLAEQRTVGGSTFAWFYTSSSGFGVIWSFHLPGCRTFCVAVVNYLQIIYKQQFYLSLSGNSNYPLTYYCLIWFKSIYEQTMGLGLGYTWSRLFKPENNDYNYNHICQNLANSLSRNISDSYSWRILLNWGRPKFVPSQCFCCCKIELT